MDYSKESLKLHEKLKGKIEIISRAKVNNKEELSLAYTPGVAEPCLEIQKDINKSYDLTRRWNTVAVVTDGSAVLGLGNIGPEAGMPVMEGKCVLFKEFGDVDAIPLCIRSNDVSEIVRTVKLLSGSFGGVNLEDISAPRCFEIERQLKEKCDIPIFHDDQHGTAVVCGAAIINSMRITGKKLEECKVVISGVGAAGVAICKFLISLGLKGENVIMCDRKGIICEGDTRLEGNDSKIEMSKITNGNKIKGSLAVAMEGADIFIGVSGPRTVNKDMISSMNIDPIVLPMSNPVPEIMPDEAKEAGARIVGTGRSDFPNQINNVLCFPGLFRGALDARASDITEEMKVAAAYALADFIPEDKLTEDYIIPHAFDEGVNKAVSQAVYDAAIESGVSRI